MEHLLVLIMGNYNEGGWIARMRRELKKRNHTAICIDYQDVCDYNTFYNKLDELNKHRDVSNVHLYVMDYNKICSDTIMLDIKLSILQQKYVAIIIIADLDGTINYHTSFMNDINKFREITPCHLAMSVSREFNPRLIADDIQLLLL